MMDGSDFPPSVVMAAADIPISEGDLALVLMGKKPPHDITSTDLITVGDLRWLTHGRVRIPVIVTGATPMANESRNHPQQITFRTCRVADYKEQYAPARAPGQELAPESARRQTLDTWYRAYKGAARMLTSERPDEPSFVREAHDYWQLSKVQRAQQNYTPPLAEALGVLREKHGITSRKEIEKALHAPSQAFRRAITLAHAAARSPATAQKELADGKGARNQLMAAYRNIKVPLGTGVLFAMRLIPRVAVTHPVAYKPNDPLFLLHSSDKNNHPNSRANKSFDLPMVFDPQKPYATFRSDTITTELAQYHGYVSPQAMRDALEIKEPRVEMIYSYVVSCAPPINYSMIAPEHVGRYLRDLRKAAYAAWQTNTDTSVVEAHTLVNRLSPDERNQALKYITPMRDINDPLSMNKNGTRPLPASVRAAREVPEGQIGEIRTSARALREERRQIARLKKLQERERIKAEGIAGKLSEGDGWEIIGGQSATTGSHEFFCAPAPSKPTASVRGVTHKGLGLSSHHRARTHSSGIGDGIPEFPKTVLDNFDPNNSPPSPPSEPKLAGRGLRAAVLVACGEAHAGIVNPPKPRPSWKR